MPEPRNCQLPNMMVLFCIGVDRFGQARALQRHGADVVSDRNRLGGQQ